ncbi:hypothetical protein ACH5RR_010699 [Cinchona calisaya]|uniref:Dienelactone hydrolase domain-containing protein n=1 Tax=Cinchona calisaya TaxID=153742 RepID=A0ABD3AJM5_9GENT
MHMIKALPSYSLFAHQEKGIEDAKPVIADLKSKGIIAIGAAGFCWGAKVAVQVAISGHALAVVLLHPYSVTVDDIKEVNKPIAILEAEIDHSSPPELLKQFEEILKWTALSKSFWGVSHGWTVRYDEADEKAVKSAEEAHQDMLEWFVKIIILVMKMVSIVKDGTSSVKKSARVVGMIGTVPRRKFVDRCYVLHMVVDDSRLSWALSHGKTFLLFSPFLRWNLAVQLGRLSLQHRPTSFLELYL